MSAETKYTPGPLFVAQSTDGMAICKQRGDDVFALAHMNPSNDVDDAKANADLFAAAPELLEACKAAIEAANELMTEFVSKTRAANWGVINDGLYKCERAIVKAERRRRESHLPLLPLR